MAESIRKVLISFMMIAFLTTPSFAFASPVEIDENGEAIYNSPVPLELVDKYNSLQGEADVITANYNECLSNYNTAKENEEKSKETLEEIKKKIKENQDILSNALKAEYKSQMPSDFLTMIIMFANSNNWSEFSTALDYSDKIKKPYYDAIEENKSLKQQEEETLKYLEEQSKIASNALEEIENLKNRIEGVVKGFGANFEYLKNSENTKIPEGGYNNPVEAAFSRIGLPYVWGAKGDYSFDCSGFTQWCYKNSLGIDIGGTTYQQNPNGAHYNVSEAMPGDVLYRQGSSPETEHVAIYIGNGKYIHAPSPGKLVCIGNDMSNWTCALRFE